MKKLAIIFTIGAFFVFAPEAKGADICYVQGDTTSTLQIVLPESSTKEESLRRVITCSMAELNYLQTNLEIADHPDKDIVKMKNDTLKELYKAQDFYKKARTQLEAGGSVQTIAKSLKERRAVSFNDLIQRALNLNFWFKNDALFSISESRFAKTKESLRNGTVRDGVIKAEEDLKQGIEIHSKAKEAILKKEDTEKVLLTLKTSLDYLNDAYEGLIALKDSL